MKDQILKIAKVKSEKEFYKKYPTEEAFMKAHGKAFKKAAMGAKMVNDQLHQLTDFGNPPVAEFGEYIGGTADAQMKPMAFSDILTNVKAGNAGMSRKQYEDAQQQAAGKVNPKSKNDPSSLGNTIGNIGKQAMDKFGKPTSNRPSAANNYAGLGVDDDMPLDRSGGYHLSRAQDGFEIDQYAGMAKDALSAYSKTSGPGAGIAGKVAPFVGDAANVVKGFGQIEEQRNNITKANQYAQLSNVTATAAETQPQISQRRYVRPEDSLVQNDQLGSPKGNKTNFLSAQNGRSIGGNPTEIQNTYAPNDMYVGLGFEPLNDSNPKQYAYGGNVPTAEFGEYFQDSGQASIGKGVGSAIGNMIFPGVGGAVGGFLGGVAGNLLGGVDDARQLKHYQEQGRKNEQRSAWASGARSIHAQNASYMKDGGYIDDEHAWVSNSWQPQVITKFGEHRMEDLLKPPHDADMLRAGGHLQSYTPPSAEAMYTGRDQYAMGGELKTTWGGKAETMSHNPYLPGTGETVMFKGQSHDETDGKGRSGIGVKYGDGGMTDYAEYGASDADADVEVERNEPGAELIDPETGEKNLVVYGNMKIPDYGVMELGDKKAKGKKFKNYVADLSKQESKYNKSIEKAVDIVNNLSGNSSFDQLSLNASKATIMGANAKLKDIAAKKQKAAMVQNAILDTAEEFGVESDGLAKGKLKAIKDPSIGRDGKKVKKGQAGLSLLASLKGLSDEDLLDPAHPERMAALQAYSSGKGTAPYQNAVSPMAPTGYTPPIFGKRVSGTAPYAIDYSQFGGTPMSPTTPPGLDAADQPWASLTLPNFNPRQPRVNIPYQAGYMDMSPVTIPRVKPLSPLAPTSIDPAKAAKHLAGIEALKPSKTEKGDGKGKWDDFITSTINRFPFFRPTNQVPLDPSQLMGEMYALGNNQVQPVAAQTFQPMLDNPYDISLQDQINAIDSQARAAIRAAGEDPAAQAYIMSQAADSKNKVLGEQFRLNQANKAQVYQANRQALNQAQLQNLGIYDQQFVRQETAKSKTKTETIAALNSISDKIAKNKLMNRQLGIYENLYGYRFDEKGRARSINGPAQFNLYGTGKTSGGGYSNSMLGANKRFTVDPVTGEIVGVRTLTKEEMEGGLSGAADLGLLGDATKRNGGKTKKSKNGNIVKAIKNL